MQAETKVAHIEEAWRRHSHELLRYVRYRIGDAALAEDLVQEAFLRLHRANWPEDVRGWLFQVSRNLIIDQYRAVQGAVVPLPEELPAVEASELEQLRIDLAECLPQLLARLPQHYGEALRLADLEELSQQALAEQQGLTLSGAKSRVQRARRLLHKALEACCLFEKDHAGRVINFAHKAKNSCVFSARGSSSAADTKRKELSAMKQVMIEWRHLDVDGTTCERCGDTGQELRNVIGSLNRECAARGIYFTLQETLLDATTLEQSNAIHIAGRPIEELLPDTQVGSSECNSCGTLIGESSAACRTLSCGESSYETIPAALIREAVCRAVDCCAPACGCR